jgi:hypothetical protein
LRKIHRQRHVVRHRRHNAARHPPVDMLRSTVRYRPVVDDQRRGCRAELDDAAVLRRAVGAGNLSSETEPKNCAYIRLSLGRLGKTQDKAFTGCAGPARR